MLKWRARSCRKRSKRISFENTGAEIQFTSGRTPLVDPLNRLVRAQLDVEADRLVFGQVHIDVRLTVWSGPVSTPAGAVISSIP